MMIKKQLIIVLTGFLAMVMSCSGNSPNDGPAVNEVASESNYKVSLGVNYNEQFPFVDFNDLERSKTTWVRGFIDFFQMYENPSALHSDERIIKYLSLKPNGYSTILNIKWNFKARAESFPAEGSVTLKLYLGFLEQLLEKVWLQTDILVIGNEPFIETSAEEKDQRLVDFYKAVAATVKKFREKQSGHFVPVFVGALNNLYDPAWRTEATKSLMEYANGDPGIAGIDLHIHHASMDQMKSALQYAAGQMRENQKILITEFSLMKHWRAQLNNPISESFASQYQLDPAMRNYQYIDLALKNPRQATEWYNYLKASNWFESRKHYLQEAFALMTAEPRFLIATYAIRQSYPYNQDFTPTTDPWILNSLFANRTLIPDPAYGWNQPNYAFIEDFISIQIKLSVQH
jgi:hypothetical protein